MKVGVAKETAPGERRVALVPEALGKLQPAGLEILVEPGAGAGALHPRQRVRRRRRDGRPDDDLYQAADVDPARRTKPAAAEVGEPAQGPGRHRLPPAAHRSEPRPRRSPTTA